MKLPINASDQIIDGMLVEFYLIGDLLFAFATHHQFKDCALTIVQTVVRLG